jgi:molybdopterin synthase catalytic subunit/GNAT superfamily N-acetyltransferase
MTIRPVQPRDRDAYVRMRGILYDDCPPDQLTREAEENLRAETLYGVPAATFVAEAEEKLIGFAEVALRSIANGCTTSPVGYLESWYVEPQWRRKQVGQRLAEAAERWAKEQGCTEMASDCAIDNEVSRRAHLALGYVFVARCTMFQKALPSDPAASQRSRTDWIGLMSKPLPVAAAIRHVADARAGGIDAFLGTTRAESSKTGAPLVALDYEAYTEMAASQLYDLAKRAREQWPIIKLALLHRIGRVPLAEPSVVIAVSCPHRGEAFDACRWLIDTLKKEVAIWKKEVWADGSGTWVHPGG